jgi:hypothetical protein
MRQGREGLVSLANTIRVLPCESVFKRRPPRAAAKCGDQGLLYVFWGVLLGNVRAGRRLGTAVLLRTSISIPAFCQKYSLVFGAGAMFPILA